MTNMRSDHQYHLIVVKFYHYQKVNSAHQKLTSSCWTLSYITVFVNLSAFIKQLKINSASSGERGEEALRSARVGGEEPRAEEERG